eukprot:XP_011438747.1 PREDICTED: uncharacterized protein LOC105336219 [Crassostrea gigas]
MDPSSSAQDVHRCDLCETTIVQSYCDLCLVNLCKPCIGEHISDEYDKHKIVPFQKRRSTLIHSKCETHPHRNCEFQCEDCNDMFVCSSCMASNQHKGHNFVEVTEVYKAKKDDIKKDTKELENHISPTYEEIAFDLENQLASIDGGYEKLEITMSKQGEQWHREIDIIVNKMKTEISEIKVKHKELLQKHLNEIKQIQSLIKETLHALGKIEESTEVSPVIEYSSKIREFSKPPPKVKVTLPTFIPKPIDREKLYTLFGHITPLSTAIEEQILLQNQPYILYTSDRELLDEPELVATIHTGYRNLRSVTCVNEERIWTSGMTKDIKCFNIKGTTLHTILTKPGSYPDDIAVDSDGNLLYSDSETRTVYKVKRSQTEELFRLQGWKPVNLCVTSSGDLLVTMYSDDKTQSKVVRYSGSREKQTIQFDDEDSQSRILTADKDNRCIHILDQNGQILRYIDNCDLEDPFGLCVDNNDNLLVCELYKGNVKKFKYLK